MTDVLPCGCQMTADEETKAFVFVPHALDCKFYLYVLAESARQGKDVVTLDARDGAR